MILISTGRHRLQLPSVPLTLGHPPVLPGQDPQETDIADLSSDEIETIGRAWTDQFQIVASQRRARRLTEGHCHE